MSKTALAIAATAALGLLTGCAGQVEPEYPPKELRDTAGTTSIETLWEEQVGDGLGQGGYPLAPARDGDLLFAADHSGLVQAIDADSGEPRWRVELDAAASSGLTAVADRVYLGTRNGEVLALDQADGEVLWRTRVNSEVLAAPQANRQLLVVQAVDGSVTALDRASGAERWVYSGNRPALTLRSTGTPRVIDQVTFAGQANGRLVTLDNRAGQPLWQRRIAVPQGRSEIERLVDLAGQPLLTQDGRLFVTSYNGRLAALQATTGEILWARDISSYRSPVMVGDFLFVVDEASHVMAFNAGNGETLWELDDLEGRELTDPAFADGRLVVGDFEGYLHLIDAREGDLVGRTEIDDAISVAPLTDGKRIYALADDGSLEALELQP
ncbi:MULTISPECIES: outer membrane protein assembly factor BamB [Halomonas]|uniref:Outer membrane protein assembly factor BamB n=1 Tax=Halomonas halophila TaxID=29573 RepID=A0ABQ0U366_9GAMM|nr:MULTISPECIES: outer membrane protein assembly factor BamB [Halomonas]MDR5888542.1 outer membrane protein assembly factor BamB [Halomonas salina]WJY07723.1 outer membrane protein assembly factor BamB [Halomonas halophila]GEK72989.1 outer membrane protein assembly factor BamB [Halomonas halophila]